MIVRENNFTKLQDILPIENGYTAPLPLNEAGECEAIAIGNYANPKTPKPLLRFVFINY